jgi:uncharacterized protein (UPF0332 family)
LRETEVLLERAKETLEAARLLLERGFYEDSVSRSYYAMLYSVRAALVTKRIHAKTHRGTMKKFGELFVKTGEFPLEVWRVFGSAMELREEADYSAGTEMTITERKAQEVLEAAAEFIREIEKAVDLSI